LKGQNALNNQFLCQELIAGAHFEFACRGQEDHIGQQRPVQRRKDRHGHAFADFRRVIEGNEHLHHPDKGADHSKSRSECPHGEENRLPHRMTVFHEGKLSRKYVLDELRSGAIDGQLNTSFEKLIPRFTSMGFQRQDSLPAGNGGEADQFGNQILGRGFFVKERVLDRVQDAQHVAQRKIDECGRQRPPDHDHNG